jgi:hypothetical protein
LKGRPKYDPVLEKNIPENFSPSATSLDLVSSPFSRLKQQQQGGMNISRIAISY